MDRTYSSGAAGSAPSAPASPSSGYPTAGNPDTGTPATKPGPYWYHMIMEELMAIISAAGITPAQGNLTQLLTALRSSGVFQTAPQFDNDTSVATTEFVQRALGNFQGFREPSVNTTLDASDVGKVITVNNTTITLTLPGADNLAPGSAIAICNVSPQGGAIVTVQRQGADQIWVGTGQGLTSFTLAPSESVTLVRQAANSWKQVSGQIGFGSSLAASGYQKLPSGLIIQWGSFSASGTADTAVTFPLAFPTACQAVMATHGPYAGPDIGSSVVVSKTTSGFSYASYQSNGSVVRNGAQTVSYFAIGY